MPFCILRCTTVIYSLIVISVGDQEESPLIISEELLRVRIKGGTPTEIEIYPFLVSIQKQSTPRCTGSLISDSWIITAAHCLIDLNLRITQILDPSYFLVISGRTILTSGRMEGQERKPEIFVIHSRFKRDTLKYNVGLIKTYMPFVYGKSTHPIKLNTVSPELASAFPNYILIGWNTGKHYFDDYEEPELKPNTMKLTRMNLEMMKLSKCRQILGRLASVDILCTYLNGKCPGQSGSPLLWENFLTGIFSWTAGCENVSYPAVFVDIGKMNVWILSITRGDYRESFRRRSSFATKTTQDTVSLFLLFFSPISIFR